MEATEKAAIEMESIEVDSMVVVIVTPTTEPESWRLILHSSPKEQADENPAGIFL
jgi:hypothetical protein